MGKVDPKVGLTMNPKKGVHDTSSNRESPAKRGDDKLERATNFTYLGVK